MKKILPVVVLAALAGVNGAQAVHVDADGLGQVLLYPAYVDLVDNALIHGPPLGLSITLAYHEDRAQAVHAFHEYVNVDYSAQWVEQSENGFATPKAGYQVVEFNFTYEELAVPVSSGFQGVLDIMPGLSKAIIIPSGLEVTNSYDGVDLVLGSPTQPGTDLTSVVPGSDGGISGYEVLEVTAEKAFGIVLGQVRGIASYQLYAAYGGTAPEPVIAVVSDTRTQLAYQLPAFYEAPS
jgi:hypothetical protein